METSNELLLVGEIIVDFTVSAQGRQCKLRLGGIVHAARGLWAIGKNFSVAVVCPQYLIDQARRYLSSHGCRDFFWLGDVVGSPNVMIIGDPTEVALQGYEDLLREEKLVKMLSRPDNFRDFDEVLVFPGAYELSHIRNWLPASTKFSFDIAYNVSELKTLDCYKGAIRVLTISTSSDLFLEHAADEIDGFVSATKNYASECFVLKENRGGSSLYVFADESVHRIPATLDETVNSVGVGDVYTAVLIGLCKEDWPVAALRASRVAACYARTTFPDDFHRDVRRDFNLTFDQINGLGGVILPWHQRQQFQIYLAAPDFTYIHVRDREYINSVLGSLKYHNFIVRRPVFENGELTRPCEHSELMPVFQKDCQLLKTCSLVFAVPLGRDPGTLVEVGMAIALDKPVVTFDPYKENDNTMVMGGSHSYSDDLGVCLNEVFRILSDCLKGLHP